MEMCPPISLCSRWALETIQEHTVDPMSGTVDPRSGMPGGPGQRPADGKPAGARSARRDALETRGGRLRSDARRAAGRRRAGRSRLARPAPTPGRRGRRRGPGAHDGAGGLLTRCVKGGGPSRRQPPGEPAAALRVAPSGDLPREDRSLVHRSSSTSTDWLWPLSTSTSTVWSLYPGRETVTMWRPGETRSPCGCPSSSSAVPTNRSST